MSVVENFTELRVREAASSDEENENDARLLRALIQELADFQGLSDGPRVGADQLQRHLKNGAATALIATATKGGGQNCEKMEADGEKEMVVGYAVYFVCPSVQFGKVFFLEDLYLRPDFRRHKFGSQLMQRLSECARTSRSDAFLWNAHSFNKGAILFYNSLGSLPDIKLTVLDNVHLNEKAAIKLAEDWCRLCDNASPAPNAEKKALLQAVRVGGFRIIQAQNLYGTVLGIALFHHCAFSTWNGPYITIDRLRVHAEHRRKGIGKKLVAELFSIAAELNCPKIRWTAHADASTDALFTSFGATNLTEKEGCLLFQLKLN
uniref:N-acetyltransferase domain-containing protein n=1 Tax=Globodera rostochiensis TaxID=31243 RepID=A0A914I294_GLORO